jgi:acetate kinase
MKILVINAGSSSMKYQLIDMDNESVIAKGNCERIGNGGFIGHKLADGTKIEYDVDFPTHAEAFAEVLKLLSTGEHKVINDMSEIAAVGHRIVHGGEKFASSVLITEEVLQAIDELSSIAPLHNPPALAAIKASEKIFGDKTPMVAVPDTAFHQTMPPKAYMYGIPYEFYEKHGVRRYGFHGTSHRFVAGRACELLGKKAEDLKIITCHLGNGSSLAAVNNGKVLDTSLGMTTNSGIIMGTRSGDIDPGIPALICEKAGVTIEEATTILQKKSGLLGISGVSPDMRDIESAVEQGNERAKLAWDMLVYHIKKYIGAYAANMGGVDAIVFTGGIGENDDKVRAAVCENLEFMGVQFDAAKNKGCREEACISAPESRVKVWVIPTNEELLIARDTKDIVSKL